MNQLLFHWTHQNLLVVDGQRKPVWPITNDEEFRAVSAAAKLFGVAIEETASYYNCPELIATSSKLVVGFMLPDLGPAVLYAHLTSRKFLQIDDLFSLKLLDDVEVVITTSANLSLEFIESLYYEKSKSPGILFAQNTATLFKVIKKFAVALLQPATLNKRRLISADERDFQFPASQNVDCIKDASDKLSKECVRLGLESASDFLALTAHSDGIDAYLTSGIVLCPFATGDLERTGQVPLCLELQRCTRYPDLPDISDAFRTRPIIHTSKLCAKILLLTMCNAVRVVDDVLDPSFNLATSIIENSIIGAAITSWQQMDADTEWVSYVLARLDGGESIGVIVSELNRRRDGPLSRIGLCVIGDPAISAVNRDHLSINPMPISEQDSTIHAMPILPGCSENTLTKLQVKFMLSAVRCGIERNLYCDEDAATKLARKLETISLLDDIQIQDVSASLQDEILCYFSSFPVGIDDAWGLMNSSGRFMSRDFACPICCGRSQLIRLIFEMSPLVDRYSVWCPRCGNVLNSPVGVSPCIDKVSINGSALRLVNVPTRSRGVVNLISRHFPFTQTYNWPIDINGELAQEFQMPPEHVIPSGPLLCRILLAWDFQIAAISFRIRSR